MRIKLTDDMIRMGGCGAGGWSRAQVTALGLPWPLTRGWISRAVGRSVPLSALSRFLRLRGEPVGKLDASKCFRRHSPRYGWQVVYDSVRE